MTARAHNHAPDGPRAKASVARQPICDREQQTFAYELLFRNSEINAAVFDDPDQATQQVVFDSLMEIGLDRIVGQALAFINVTRDFILSGHCRSLPRKRVVLEIVEDTQPDAELLEALGDLTADGYVFALDDYAFEDRMQPLVPYCRYIKVDAKLTPPSLVASRIERLKPFPVKLLAEKVETAEEFEVFRQAGFDYFQGFFFCKPRILSSPRISRNPAAIGHLLARIHRPEIDVREIETIVSADLALSYQLLRYINSAAVAIPRKIESIGHAVRLMGVERIRTMAGIMMLAGADDKPQELFTTSLVRARMCEVMAQQQGYENPGSYFTAGLFSCLDAVLDCKMEDALRFLPLSNEICDALLRCEGRLGSVLKLVLSYEAGDWGVLDKHPVPAVPMGNAYLEAVDFGEKLVRQFRLTSKPTRPS